MYYLGYENERKRQRKRERESERAIWNQRIVSFKENMCLHLYKRKCAVKTDKLTLKICIFVNDLLL